MSSQYYYNTISCLLRATTDLREPYLFVSFGFLDGISHPAVEGFDTKPNPGQQTVSQGIILLGRPGDEIIRPKWAVDGSL